LYQYLKGKTVVAVAEHINVSRLFFLLYKACNVGQEEYDISASTNINKIDVLANFVEQLELFSISQKQLTELSGVANTVQGDHTKDHSASSPNQEEGKEELDLCSICCDHVVDTWFVPCHHSSCSKCIKRHLLNSDKCFFCNAKITSTTTAPPVEGYIVS
jgi:hypothetical protein